MATTDSRLKTIVALFDTLGEANSTVKDLVAEGFPREDTNLVAHASAEEFDRYFDKQGSFIDPLPPIHTGAVHGAETGAVVGGLAGLLMGMSMLPIPGIGPVLAGGTIASILIGAGAGALAGGLFGALTDQGIPDEHAEYFAEGVRRGGTLVLLKTDEASMARAAEIVQRHNPVDMQQRVSDWRGTGWSNFDPAAAPYTPAQIVEERALAVRNPGNNLPVAPIPVEHALAVPAAPPYTASQVDADLALSSPLNPHPIP